MTAQNIFKVTYMSRDGCDDPLEREAYVVVPTWEDLVEYMHKNHGSLVNAESISCYGERVEVLIAPQSGASDNGHQQP